MERPILPRKNLPLRRGLFALTLSAASVGTILTTLETIDSSTSRAGAEGTLATGFMKQLVSVIPNTSTPENDVYEIKRTETEARRQAEIAYMASSALTRSVSTPTSVVSQANTNTGPHPNIPVTYSSGTDGSNAFTPDWYRCVIDPESGGNANDTSGLFGILVSTWQNYLHMSGVPGEYSPSVQGEEALILFHDNYGFGPPAWNNTAHCGKNG